MTAAHVILLAMVPPAYVLGSVPFGLLVGRARGIDPRKAGSGNIGATNLGRLLGGRYFALVFTLDLLKGLAPTVAAGAVLWALRAHGATWARTLSAYGPVDYALWLAVGFAAICGHMFSLFLRFAGGKGVATSAGVILGLFPFYTIPGLLAMLIWLAVFRITRYVSVASMLAAICFVLAYLAVGLAVHWPVFDRQWPLLLFACLVAAMIVYKHRGNLARLRAGTEHRFGTVPRA